MFTFLRLVWADVCVAGNLKNSLKQMHLGTYLLPELYSEFILTEFYLCLHHIHFYFNSPLMLLRWKTLEAVLSICTGCANVDCVANGQSAVTMDAFSLSFYYLYLPSSHFSQFSVFHFFWAVFTFSFLLHYTPTLCIFLVAKINYMRCIVFFNCFL